MKIIYSLLLLLTGSTAFSQPGFLDASFGSGGKVVTQTGDSSSVANAVVTSAGKILVGGYSFIAGQSLATLLQYNSDGTLDTTFGIKGKTILAVNSQSAINSIALQSDGKIIAGGYYKGYNPFYYSHFLIARFTPNGSLDSAFGINGMANNVLDSSIFSGGEVANKIILKPDGKILTGGRLSRLDFENYALYAQYLPNGNIDSSFGTNGTRVASTNFVYLATADNVNDLAITTDGKTLAIINETPYFPTGTSFFINRFLPNGDYDSTFGTNGSVITYIGATSGGIAYSTVVLADNSFVVAGASYAGPPAYITSIALIKYYPDGSLDSTFGTNGKVLTVITGSYAYSSHILLSSDGSLIVSGYTFYSGKGDFVLAKYLPDGTLDSSFGTNGITITDFSGNSDISYSSAMQPDGKVVLAGSTGNSANYNIALARYGNVILPLHLLSFTATKTETANLLQWQTAQEINTSAFEVQRSADGKTYSSIGYIKAGSSFYHFTDNNPLRDNNYYRLKMIDRNGTFIYSPVRIINNGHSLEIKVYPNPAKSNLQVQIANNNETTIQWQVISAGGKVLMSNQWSLQSGSSVKNINVAALAKGNYYLVITAGNNEQSVVKFEKL